MREPVRCGEWVKGGSDGPRQQALREKHTELSKRLYVLHAFHMLQSNDLILLCDNSL
jgi:hypothetical protein